MAGNTPAYTPAAFPLLRLRALRSAGYRCAECQGMTSHVTTELEVRCVPCVQVASAHAQDAER